MFLLIFLKELEYTERHRLKIFLVDYTVQGSDFNNEYPKTDNKNFRVGTKSSGNTYFSLA